MQLQDVNNKLKTFRLTEVQKAKVSLKIGVSVSTVRNYLRGKVPEFNFADGVRIIEFIENGFSN